MKNRRPGSPAREEGGATGHTPTRHKRKGGIRGPCIINTAPVFRAELRRSAYIYISQSISEYKASGR